MRIYSVGRVDAATVEELHGAPCVVLTGTIDEVRSVGPHVLREVSLVPSPPAQMTLESLTTPAGAKVPSDDAAHENEACALLVDTLLGSGNTVSTRIRNRMAAHALMKMREASRG